MFGSFVVRPFVIPARIAMALVLMSLGVATAFAQSTSLNNIQHIVFIIKENRSFDNYFGTFPGADGATTGKISTGDVIPLGHTPDRTPHDLCHSWFCATQSIDGGNTWRTAVRLTDTTTNPNYEQFSNRAVPFAGDYLWITSIGQFAFGVWTDWRNTVAGRDPREIGSLNDGADVKQCRTFNPVSGWSGDQCPHDGGIDQNIYGNGAP